MVDAATARVLQKEVSDGVIAPGFDADALAILSSKKGGKFVCIEMDANYTPPAVELREVYGTRPRRLDDSGGGFSHWCWETEYGRRTGVSCAIWTMESVLWKKLHGTRAVLERWIVPKYLGI